MAKLASHMFHVCSMSDGATCCWSGGQVAGAAGGGFFMVFLLCKRFSEVKKDPTWHCAFTSVKIGWGSLGSLELDIRKPCRPQHESLRPTQLSSTVASSCQAAEAKAQQNEADLKEAQGPGFRIFSGHWQMGFRGCWMQTASDLAGFPKNRAGARRGCQKVGAPWTKGTRDVGDLPQTWSQGSLSTIQWLSNHNYHGKVATGHHNYTSSTSAVPKVQFFRF